MGKSSTQTSKAEPWSAIQPYLKGVAGDVAGLADRGMLAPKPVMGRTTDQALRGIAGMARNNPLTDAATQGLTSFMQAGPANLDGVYDYTASKVLPQVAGMFGQGGFANSTMAQQTAADAMTNAFAPIALNQRNTEDQLQLQGLGLAPTISGMGYQDASALLGVGQQRDAFNNARRGAAGQNATQAANLFAMLGGLGGSQSQSQSPSAMDTLGGLGQLGTNAALAFTLLSDRRTKTDIEEVPAKTYTFRYKFDPPGTKRIGNMAQDMPKRAQVTLPSGLKAIDYGAL